MKVYGWHFLPDDERLLYAHNGKHVAIWPGTVLRVKPPLEMCRHGLHFSVRAIDALQYAQGSVVERVECSGEIILEDDKGICEVRKTLWLANVQWVLHEFACWCAEQVLDATDDPRVANAIATKRRWLADVATDDELAAAYSVARSAAYSAASSVASSAQNEQLERILRKIGGKDEPKNA